MIIIGKSIRQIRVKSIPSHLETAYSLVYNWIAPPSDLNTLHETAVTDSVISPRKNGKILVFYQSNYYKNLNTD